METLQKILDKLGSYGVVVVDKVGTAGYEVTVLNACGCQADVVYLKWNESGEGTKSEPQSLAREKRLDTALSNALSKLEPKTKRFTDEDGKVWECKLIEEEG